jgi:glutathione peroxidase-family protein
LLNRDGELVNSFSSRVKPESDELRGAVQALL